MDIDDFISKLQNAAVTFNQPVVYYHRGNKEQIDFIKQMYNVPEHIQMCNGLKYNGTLFFPYPTLDNHRIEITDICRHRKL